MEHKLGYRPAKIQSFGLSRSNLMDDGGKHPSPAKIKFLRETAVTLLSVESNRLVRYQKNLQVLIIVRKDKI